MDLSKIVQVALLGEVPPTLRFLYASVERGTLNFHAVFTDDATEEQIECARIVLTEIVAACPRGIVVSDRIESNSNEPWKKGDGANLFYLRHGELNDT